MRHSSLHEWADFARDVVSKKRKAAMHRHLEGGCTECRRILQTWMSVYEIARLDSCYEPPVSALRSVKSLYAIQRLQKAKFPEIVTAQLLFDSSLNGLSAGTRSPSNSVRQMLYGTDAYEIDVRLEPQYDTEKVSLIGQILTPDEFDRPINGIPVTLVRDGKVLDQSTTNTLGEFQLECELEDGFYLQFDPPRGSSFCIPLIEPNRAIAGLASDRDGAT